MLHFLIINIGEAKLGTTLFLKPFLVPCQSATQLTSRYLLPNVIRRLLLFREGKNLQRIVAIGHLIVEDHLYIVRLALTIRRWTTAQQKRKAKK